MYEDSFKKNIYRFKTGCGWEALACSLHRDLCTWSSCCDGPLPITRAWCYSLPLFVTNRTITRRSSNGGLYVCAGGIDILKLDHKIHWFIVSGVQGGGERGDGTGHPRQGSIQRVKLQKLKCW